MRTCTVLRADYALFYKPYIPLAVVAAKDKRHAVGAGTCVAELRQCLATIQSTQAPSGWGAGGKCGLVLFIRQRLHHAYKQNPSKKLA